MLATLHLTRAWVSWWRHLLHHFVLVSWLCSPTVSGHWCVTASNLNSVFHWGLLVNVLPVLCRRLWRYWCYQYSWLRGLHIQEIYSIDGESLLSGISQGRSLVVLRIGVWCCPSVHYFDYIGTGVHCWSPVTSPEGNRAEPPFHSLRNECRCAWIELYES